MRPSQITDWCQEILRTQARPGGLYIDATMGNGHDTLFFSRLAGESGRVLAFDIQPAALESTRELLKDQGMAERAELILDSMSIWIPTLNGGLWMPSVLISAICRAATIRLQPGQTPALRQ